MTSEHLNVLIVGAGLSGIGAAYRIQTQCPRLSFAILEARAEIGGTWDLFRYPGVRSDSDMFTLGYPFAPWKGENAISDGESILRYIRDTASKYDIDKTIRFQHKVTSASWCSQKVRWTVTTTRADGATAIFTANFLHLCGGYYSYDKGYTPKIPGREQFAGPIVHPQEWPVDLDYSDKRVVIIGSGATAVTLVPAIAKTARLVTMLQRSPSYIAALPSSDLVADGLRKVLPEQSAHSLIRWKNVVLGIALYQLCRRAPKLTARALRAQVARSLPKDYPVDEHFRPTYRPWDQRLCLVPDGDFFKAICSGSADIVTDHIQEFTSAGVRLKSGKVLEADIIVTATGLELVFAAGISLSVDGTHISPRDHFIYKGLMMSDVPNLAVSIGYTNASWTLRADLSAQYLCRLLNYMEEHGFTQCTATSHNTEMATRPILDLDSGYVQRASELLPKQGNKAPWFLRQNYIFDMLSTRFGDLADDMHFR